MTPTSAGEWSVHLAWSGSGAPGEQLLKFPVFESVQTATPITETFVDRMDTCVTGVQRTRSGLTLCERSDQNIWVYSGADAGITSFFGIQLYVQGDEVWTVVSNSVQHRTDVGGSLRYDGAVDLNLSGQVTELATGRYVRSAYNGVAVALWDGSTLSAVHATNVPGADFLEPDGGAWTLDSCSVKPGCQQTACAPIITCPPMHLQLTQPTLVSPDAVWGIKSYLSGGYVQANFRMLERPLSSVTEGAVATLTVPQLAGTDVAYGFAGGPSAVPYFKTGRHLLFAQRDAGTITFRALPWTGGLIAATREWLIEPGPDPLTLVFTPTP